MNILGAQGWQIVTARRASSGGSMAYETVLRRPLPRSLAAHHMQVQKDKLQAMITDVKGRLEAAKAREASMPSAQQIQPASEQTGFAPR